MNLELFRDNQDLHFATKQLFKEQLQIKINELPSNKLSVTDYFKDLENTLLAHIESIYTVGLVNESTFSDENAITNWEETIDYQTIFIIAIELKKELKRSDLATLTRLLNKPANTNDKGNPVIAIFRYGNTITLSSLERQARNPKDWRDGEKISSTKVSMLKDVDFEKPHRAHIEILSELAKHKSTNFQHLYQYWQRKLNTKELNNQFYKELFKWYLWAKDNVTFPNDLNEEQDKYISESLIRFISRMLFVWFMKEKNLIPKVLFDEQSLKRILESFDKNSSNNLYYRAILQNLFFATLNVPIEERKWIDGKKRNKAQQGDPLIYRFESEFIKSDDAIENIFMRIPFLNGGLFECLDDRVNNIFVDGFTKNSKKQPQFPNFLFFGEHNTIDLSHHFADDAKEKKKWQNQNITGILDLLNNFKFTVEENTPLEVDVALDPELLGKVFENLLASFNPETKATARNQTGSFYTPREIVNYMVEESLKQHLKTNLPQNEKEVEDLFKNELEGINNTLKKQIVNKLFDCKILDPACGSGAYPMGVLHKMVELMTVLDNDNYFLKENEGKKLDDLIKDAHKLSDTNTRNQTIVALNKQKEILQKAELDYVRKLYIIENCIYGIDIQPIAIQISKLRFFISLLVEQTKNENHPNLGIEPLPNMDFKLVAANSLIAPPQEDKGLGLFETHNDFFDEFESLTHDYFTLHSPSLKKEKKEEIKGIINQKVLEKKLLIKRETDVGKKAKNLEKSVQLWESYPNLFREKAVEFFDIPYFFPKVKEGFDVVIGNPPYVQCPKGIFSEELFPYSEKKDKGKQNLYKVFVENSYNLLKNNGTASMIVQSSLMCDISSQYTRELLLTKTIINHIIEFPKKAKTKEGQVFESVLQGTCVYNFIKSIPSQETIFNVSIDNDSTTVSNLKYETLNQFGLIEIYPLGYFIPLVNFRDFSLIKKISKSSVFLSGLIEEISQGDLNLTSDKNYFGSEISEIVLLRGKHTHKYFIDYSSDEFVLADFKADVSQLYLVKNYFVCQQITGTTDKHRIHIALTDKKRVLFGNSVNKFSLKNSSMNEYVLAILNSKLIDWYFRKTSTNNHVNGYEIEQLPIKISKKPKSFNLLVNEIIGLKQNAQDTSNLEHQIDVMVYHLYELSYEEACVIDAHLTKSDFDKYRI